MTKKRKSGKKKGGLNKKDLFGMVYGIFANEPALTYNYKQISKKLGIKNMDERRLVVGVLYELRDRGDLLEVSTGKFKMKSRSGYITGVVDMTARGSAYIVSQDVEDDIFVSQANLNRALNGDEVKVYVFARRKRRQPEGEVVEIIKRKRDTFVGIIERSENFAFLTGIGKQMPYDIFIPIPKLKDAKNGEKAIVKITEWGKKHKNPIGKVEKVLGMPGNNETEMHAILAEYGLPYEFPKTVERAADGIQEDISKEDLAERRDFRDVTTFTIDPADAKDFDDALSIRKLENGNWEVGVHIADVTHYVTPGSVLDEEAYGRATSVYLVDRVVPMLPERLSNGICSLRPNEEKLTFSAVFEMDDNARVLKSWLGRTVICSDRRYAYEEVQEIIEGDEGDYKEEIMVLDTLAKKVRAERFKMGAIEFDREEVKFEIDKDGKPLSVYFKRSLDAHKLIEEFMLLANKTVASFIGKVPNDKKAKTFVYRVHDKPNEEKLNSFNYFIRKFGYGIKTTSKRAITNTMNNLLHSVKDTPQQNLIENLAVRTMAKAEYSTLNIGHYGLSFDYYTHFTSPIRRYPDMMVHRLLQRYLDKGRSVDEDKYEEMCKHCSDMETIAANAERSSIKYKQVEFMSDKVGEMFFGTISGVTEWGFYVELDDNKCEGMVPISGLEGDFYEFDEDNYSIVGRYHRKIYQLGDQVRIKVLSANLAAKQLDFALV